MGIFITIDEDAFFYACFPPSSPRSNFSTLM
ncbi:Uncharacterised protein [Serratia marcescens]|jgi:hypothetical protein|nr:hypothetical protein AF54_00605 [Serratia marcescens BIDMC 81]BEM91439.1 hypothetical protein SME53J_08780 [Serratia marcescens]CAI0934183.1 Uncharacterised protein [Serratia marcescens]